MIVRTNEARPGPIAAGIGESTTTGETAHGGPGEKPPADGPGEVAALRAFESANDRAATPAERKILRDLAERFQPAADAVRQEWDKAPDSGWGWLEAAVWEAVEAGSAFVAPRRLREILLRWERDGFPAPRDPQPTHPEPPVGATRRIVRADDAAPEPRPLPPVFVIEEVGLSNRQVWAAVLTEMASSGDVSRADLDTWLRPASLVGREGDTLIIGAPNAVARDRIASRLLPVLCQALTATIGVALTVTVETDEQTSSRKTGAVG